MSTCILPLLAVVLELKKESRLCMVVDEHYIGGEDMISMQSHLLEGVIIAHIRQ
jgi:hypothetical protein